MSVIKRNIIRIKNFRKGISLSYKTVVGLSSKFEGCNRIGKNTFFSGKIGYASYIGNDCHIVADIGSLVDY